MTEMIKRYNASDLSSWYTNTKITDDTILGVHESEVDANKLASVLTTEFTGYNIVDYHKRLKMGELLPHTPFEKFSQASEGAMYANWDYKIFQTNMVDTIRQYYTPGNSFSSSPFPDKAYLQGYAADAQKFASEAAAKVYSEGFDALTFLAEITEIHGMFRDLAKKLVKLDLPANWREVSCEWLSYRYGWRTLLMDLKDLNELIQEFNTEGRARHSAKSGTTYSTEDNSIDVPTPLTFFTLYVTKRRKVEVSLVGSVTADIEVPKLQFNPFATAWELIPFSFVVDWFVAIGVTISKWSFLLRQSAYAASYGYKITCDYTQTRTYTSSHTRFIEGDFSLLAKGRSVLERRVPCSVPLQPHFMLRLNGFKVFDLLALLTQLKTRR